MITDRKIPSALSFSLIFFLLGSISGCGGGGTGAAELNRNAPPAVASSGAANGDILITPTSAVRLTFDKPVDPSTVTSATFVVTDSSGQFVPGNVSCSGTVADFRPIAPFLARAEYRVNLGVEVRDQDGNHLSAPFTWLFFVSASPSGDTVAPSVLSVAPGKDASNILTDTTIIVLFSEEIQPASVDNGTFQLRDSTGAAVPGVLSCSGTIATFVPSSSLPPGASFTVMLGTGIRDLSGNPLTEAFSWSFSTAPNVAPDLIPPYLLDISPAIGSQDADPGAPVRVVFSEPVAIPAGTTLLSDRNGAPVPGALSLEGSAALFLPSVSLAAGESYTVSLPTSIKDLSGNPLGGTLSCRFTTRSEPPPPVLLVEDLLGYWTAAVGGNGDQFFAWVAYRDGNPSQAGLERHVLFAARRRAGGPLEPPVEIGTFTSVDSMGPGIVVDRDGNALIAWTARETLGPPGGVFLKTVRYSTTGGWGTITSTLVAPTDWGSSLIFEMKGDSDGNAVAIWDVNPGNAIYGRAYSPRSGWGEVVRLNPDNSYYADDPRVAVSAGGVAMVVWRDSPVNSYSGGPRPRASARRYHPESGWDINPFVLSNATDAPYFPRVAMDLTGNATVIWRAVNLTLYQRGFGSRRYDAVKGWDPGSTFVQGGDSLITNVAMAPDGRALASFCDASYGFRSFLYTPGNGWGEGQPMLPVAIGPPFYPPSRHLEANPIVAEGNGDFVSVWCGPDGQNVRVWTRRHSPVPGWTAPVPLSDNTAGVCAVYLAGNERGNPVAVWLRGSTFGPSRKASLWVSPIR